jgi:CRISPR/Cas system CSM-associated protein Csm3 (group 7 of RAMP superfamily)
MGARPLVARWVIQGRLTLLTALHLGGGEGDHIDMPVLRDGRTGRPLLPGTTLAGALRSALGDRLAGYGAREPVEVSYLFGGCRGDDDGAQSPLIVFDAIGTLPKGATIEARDGVAISPSTGIAEDHEKYDFEVLPADTTFPVRVDLLVPGEGRVDEEQLLAWLAASLDAFSNGDNGFGARRTRGLGRVRAEWSAKRYDLSTKQGWLEWARSDHEPALPSTLGSIHDALAATPKGSQLVQPPDARALVTFRLSLQVEHDILVRSAGTTPDAPDVAHLRSGGVPILPGTSLAGVMRAQALRIARLVRAAHGDAERWIDQLFGPRFEGRRAAPGFEPRASRLRVGEAKIEQSFSQRQARIAIDRFTQGVVDGALFDEQPEVRGNISLTLELKNPQPGEVGLVLLVLKDLLEGRLPVGGTSSVGRGFVKGTATVAFHSPNRSGHMEAQLAPGKAPEGAAAQRVNEEIAAFASEPTRTMPISSMGGEP